MGYKEDSAMIVFSSFIRAVYDRDILPAWIAHYRKFLFDRYTVFLHDVEGEEQYTEEARSIFQEEGYEIGILKGSYDNGALQASALESLRLSLKNDDYMVVADSDEFHDMPQDYCDIIKKYEIVRGSMIDKWTTRGLPSGGTDIHALYPESGYLWDYLVKLEKISRDLVLDLPRNKLMAFRAFWPVNMNGCHIVKGSRVADPNIMLDGQRIDHFTWRKGILKRMAGKSYFHSSHIAVIMNYFNISPFSSEIEEVKDILNRRFAKTDAMVKLL